MYAVDQKQKKRKSRYVANARVSEVYEMILHGVPTSEIIKRCSKWQVTDSNIRLYIARARREFSNLYGSSHRKGLTDMYLAKLSLLYHKNYEKGDYRECRRLIEAASKLLGLNEQQEIKAEQNIFNINVVNSVGEGGKTTDKALEVVTKGDLVNGSESRRSRESVKNYKWE